VESTVRLRSDVPGWEVATAPTIQVGLSEGDPRYAFSRVTGAVRTTDGMIVVGDGTSNEIRFLDESGGIRRSVGRTGQGLGEFEDPRGLLQEATLGKGGPPAWAMLRQPQSTPA